MRDPNLKTLLQVRSRQATASGAIKQAKRSIGGPPRNSQPGMAMQSHPSFSQLNVAPLSNESASKAMLNEVPSAAGLGSLASVDTK